MCGEHGVFLPPGGLQPGWLQLMPPTPHVTGYFIGDLLLVKKQSKHLFLPYLHSPVLPNVGNMHEETGLGKNTIRHYRVNMRMPKRYNKSAALRRIPYA
jgi:hypothetical protein